MPTAAALLLSPLRIWFIQTLRSKKVIFIRHKYPQDISAVNSAVGKRTFTGACTHLSLIGFLFIAREQFSYSIQHFLSSHLSTWSIIACVLLHVPTSAETASNLYLNFTVLSLNTGFAPEKDELLTNLTKETHKVLDLQLCSLNLSERHQMTQ